jgi:hypothetical protein
MICYQIIGEKIELIFRYYNKNNNRSTLNRFYPMIYKGKYIFSQDDDVLKAFSLQKSKYVFTTAFPHDYGAIQLFPLFNGNLLLVYSTESYSYDGKKSYSLMEVTIFQNDIFIVQKYEFKVKSIVTQLKDGTIIYNPPDK